MTPRARKMAERQAAGLCRRCGSAQAPGRALCEHHLARERDQKRARDAKRKAAGLCVVAGCGRKPEGGHIRCGPCHERFSAANLAWQREHRVRASE